MATKRLPTLPFLPNVPATVTPQYASQLNLAINSFYRNIVQSVDEMVVTATHTSLFPAAKGLKRLAFNGSSLYIDWNTTSWTPIGATAPTSKFQAGFSTTASGATSGVTGTASRTLWMYPGPNITFSGATAADQLSLTIIGNSGATGGAGVALNISGNTSGVASTYTSGTVCLSAGANITIGEGDQTLSIIGPTIPAATSHVLAISGNTSGVASTYTSGTVVLSAGANITIGEGNQTLSIIGPTIPAATSHVLAVSGNTSGVASTYTSGTVILSAGNNITIGMGNQSMSIIGPTVPAVTAHSLLISGNTAGVSSLYSSGSIVISAGANITISEGDQTLTIVGPTPAAGGGPTLLISGNTGGIASTYSSGTVVLSASAGINISEGNQTMTISAPLAGYMSSVGAGGLAAINVSSLSIAAGAGISLATASAAGALTITVSNTGAAAPAQSHIEINPGVGLVTVVGFSNTAFAKRPIILPFYVDGTGLTPATVRFLVSGVGSSNRSLVGSYRVRLYSQDNSTHLTSVAFTSMAISITDAAASTVWNGIKALDFTGMTTPLSQGHYALGLHIENNSNNATFASMLIYGAAAFPTLGGYIAAGTTAATNGSQQIYPFRGAYAATHASLPAGIDMTDIVGEGASVWNIYAMIKAV